MVIVNNTEYSVVTLESLAWHYIGKSVSKTEGETFYVYNATGTDLYKLVYEKGDIHYVEM